jgi:hypothetical protein
LIVSTSFHNSSILRRSLRFSVNICFLNTILKTHTIFENEFKWKRASFQRRLPLFLHATGIITLSSTSPAHIYRLSPQIPVFRSCFAAPHFPFCKKGFLARFPLQLQSNSILLLRAIDGYVLSEETKFFFVSSHLNGYDCCCSKSRTNSDNLDLLKYFLADHVWIWADQTRESLNCSRSPFKCRHLQFKSLIESKNVVDMPICKISKRGGSHR